MSRVFIGVGANIKPERNIPDALKRLADRIEIFAISNFYLTEPEGRPEQPPFYNGAVAAMTDIPPLELKSSALRKIEAELGRIRRSDKYAARTIDLDILIYEDLVVSDQGLIIPDPEILSRPFLAIPLFELQPDLTIPGYNVNISEIVVQMTDHNMLPLKSFTRRLKGDLRIGQNQGRGTDKRAVERDGGGPR